MASLIGRVTDLGDTLRRFTEKVGQVLNPLLSSGQIRDLPAGQTVIRAGSFTGAVDPGVTQDAASQYAIGNLWVNTVSQHAFVCTSNTTGAAVWKRIDN